MQVLSLYIIFIKSCWWKSSHVLPGLHWSKDQCHWFLLMSTWPYGCTLVRAWAFCAGPPHSNTAPVLLVVLQSLGAPQKRLMNVVTGSTWAFLCLKVKSWPFCQRGNRSCARCSAIGYSKEGGRNFVKGHLVKRFCKWLIESGLGLRFITW